MLLLILEAEVYREKKEKEKVILGSETWVPFWLFWFEGYYHHLHNIFLHFLACELWDQTKNSVSTSRHQTIFTLREVGIISETKRINLVFGLYQPIVVINFLPLPFHPFVRFIIFLKFTITTPILQSMEINGIKYVKFRFAEVEVNNK